MNRYIKVTLALGFSLIIAMMLAIGGYSVLGMYQIKANLRGKVSENNRKTELIHAMRSAVRDRVIALQSMLIVDDPFERDEWYMHHLELANRFISARAELETLVSDPQESAMMKGLRRQVARSTPVQDAIRELISDGREAEATVLMQEEGIHLQNAIQTAFDQAIVFYQRRASDFLDYARRAYTRTFEIQAALTAGLLLLSILVAIYVYRQVVRSERKLVREIEHRRAIEHELQDHHENLEDLINQRTMELSYQATHDALTGLFNRYEFDRRLDLALSLCRTARCLSSVLYMDLDQFKVINDSCGHIAGDELLKQVADLLAQHLRKGDALARLGGDEFGVILDGCDLEQSRKIASQLKDAIGAYRFIWQNNVYSVGVSIGIASISADVLSRSEILNSADSACYLAKEQGRNRIHVFQSDDELALRRQGDMRWITRVKHALDHGQLRLYGQHIAAADDGDSTPNLEVLLRIVLGDGRVFSPSDFVPAAERYGMMPDLDRWVLNESLQYYARHILPLAADSRPVMFINVSGQSVGDEDFAARVVSLFDRYRIPPGCICLEITETAAVSNLSKASRLMSELKARGCLFALDDFGSGLSSFGYLKSLPIDFLKIDGEFVRDTVEDSVSLAMVNSINEIGHVMGIRTIAEYVETGQILDVLLDLGVDFVQGHYVSMPVPIDESLAALEGGCTQPGFVQGE